MLIVLNRLYLIYYSMLSDLYQSNLILFQSIQYHFVFVEYPNQVDFQYNLHDLLRYQPDHLNILNSFLII
jgi:hypothetical protein